MLTFRCLAARARVRANAHSARAKHDLLRFSSDFGLVAFGKGRTRNPFAVAKNHVLGSSILVDHGRENFGENFRKLKGKD